MNKLVLKITVIAILTLAYVMPCVAVVQQVSGLAVAESPTKWNNLSDAKVGDNLTNGLAAMALYVYDNGSAKWFRMRGNTAGAIAVTVTTSGTSPLTTTPVQSSLLTLGTDNATGTKTEQSLSYLTSKHTWQVAITGSPTAITVALEGSIDNSSWFQLDNSTSTTGEMRHVVNKPVLYVRENLIALTGTASAITVKSIHGGN